MGINVSKENYNQLVVIYGYNANDFPWKENYNRSIYHTSGLIFNYQGKKYIVSTRTKIISCKNIVMYHSYYTDNDSVIMRNNLQILFQSIEFNIIILGSVDHTEFDVSTSEIISGNYNPNNVLKSYNITNNSYQIPTKRSHYYTVRTDMDLESETINYTIHVYDIKFIKSVIFDKTFLPENYMYHFMIKNDEQNLVGICGAVVFNKKNQLIGLVSRTQQENLFILPTKTLTKIIFEFINNLNTHDKYNGLLSLPFSYYISKKNMVKIALDCDILTNNDHKQLKKNDTLISINNNNLVVENDRILIFDDDYKEKIPLDIYLKLNIIKNSPIPLSLSRRKKIIDIITFGLTKDIPDIPLTTISFFFPKFPISFLKVGNLIVVQLTHELLDITIANKIIIKNKIIDTYMESSTINSFNHIIIIDCLDSILAKKYNLPQLNMNLKNQILNCPSIETINGNKILTIENLESVTKNDSKIIIDATLYDNDFKIVI